jgi:hypothetical protein
MINVPNFLSAYTIENVKRGKNNNIQITLVPKSSFFNRKMVVCRYDLKKKEMVCQDLNKKYVVQARLQHAPNEQFGVICACLGLLCAKKVCLHFPYCYGEIHPKKKSPYVILEKMNLTLEHLLDTRPQGRKLNPFFLASILFEIRWGLEVAKRIFDFQHRELDLKHIGLVRVAGKRDLLLSYRDRTLGEKKMWQVQTYGYVVKILPSLLSGFGKEKCNDFQTLVCHLLPKISDNVLDTCTTRDREMSEKLLQVLGQVKNNGPQVPWMEFFAPFSKTALDDSTFFFDMPPVSEQYKLQRRLISESIQ